MGWTESQKQAIYKRGTNIIVSAGAGSGKTAVLSERILQFCLNGHDIRNVLVLTFTKAAAQEMNIWRSRPGATFIRAISLSETKNF